MKTEGLILENMQAGYAGQQILHDVSLQVGKGELCGLIGPNGSGKTTLFRSLMQTGGWAEGTCYVDGVDVMRMRQKQRALEIALLPQVFNVPQGYLCEDVLEMAFYPQLKFLQQPTRQMRQELSDVMKKLAIEDLAHRTFTTLSEGQKQLVLLGRILLQKAPVVLLDEPDAALDFEHKHQILQMFKQFIAREKKAGLMILHDPDAALMYCDRIYLMKEGRILAEIKTGKESFESMEQKFRLLYPQLVMRHKDGLFHIDYKCDSVKELI